MKRIVARRKIIVRHAGLDPASSMDSGVRRNDGTRGKLPQSSVTGSMHRRASLFLLPLAAVFDKGPLAVLIERDLEFFLCVHHYGPVPRDRFTYRFP